MKFYNMEKSISGVQSIERTIGVVRVVAQARADGVRLVDIAHRVGITMPTAHRILQALVQAGWVEQDGDRGRFRLGVELSVFGFLAAGHHEMMGLGERAVSRLAEQVGDTAYFQIRRGFNSLCLARCEGSYPVKIVTVDVGAHRPLGMGAGNLAILSFLPDSDVDRIVGANIDELKSYAAPGVDLDAERMWQLVREARELGYALVKDLFIPGMAAIGMPILGHDGTPVGALSVAAITARLEEDRRAGVADSLRKEVRAIETRLRNGEMMAGGSANGDSPEGKNEESAAVRDLRGSRRRSVPLVGALDS